MQDNQTVAKFAEQKDLGACLQDIANQIAETTGFILDGGEVQRRTLYDPNKTWRVRLSGTYQEKPALLRIENLKLEQDEETIRQAFRQQAMGSRVRPPVTYTTRPFDDEKGYAYSIDEAVGGEVLFDQTGSPVEAAKAFSVFYRLLRSAVSQPFWENEQGDVKTFSTQQADTWRSIAEKKDPEHTKHIWPLVERLREVMLNDLTDHAMRFQHPHLAGSDVRRNAAGEYVVFANHFWSWRQPGYDVTFPLWHQWMSLPVGRRTPEAIQEITETWLHMIRTDLADLVDIADVRPMLFNRLYGSLLLDIPAKIHGEGETKETVQALEDACKAEAERLMDE